MLDLLCHLEWFAVGTVDDPLERLQGAPLGAVLPPHREAHAGYGSASVDEAEDGDALEVELAGDGWSYLTPHTLASGDPSNSLTVRWGEFGSRPRIVVAPRICPRGGPRALVRAC